LGGVSLDGHNLDYGALGEIVVSKCLPRRPGVAFSDDPVTTQVVRYALVSVAEQMKRSLVRTAVTSIVYELLDFAVGVYDKQMRLLGQACGLPLFMGTLGFCIEAAVSAVGGEDTLEEGDILLLNVPYFTGAHPQDAALVMPIYFEGELIGYSAVKAHLLDVGGKEPYSTDTVDVYQEGTMFPGVKLYQRGQPVQDLVRTLVANSRMPRAVVGDIQAQVVSLRVGAEGLIRIAKRHGMDTFRASIERMFDHGEATMRARFAEIPDGEYAAWGEMDGDGVSDEPVPFEVKVKVIGSDVRVDLSAAPDARPGPINCPLPDTVSEIRVALMMLAGGGEQPNEGHFRPIEVVTRSGSMFHPLSPSPCFLASWATLQAMEVVYAALAPVIPERVPAASGGDILALLHWGQRRGTGEPWGDCTVSSVGQGAFAGGDGANALMHISQAGVRSVSIEVTELRTPWLFEQLELAPDSGGAGRYRGGLGVNVRMRATEDLWLTGIVERTKNRPWGLFGGEPGRANEALIRFPDGRVIPLRKVTRLHIPAGAVIELRSGGGGGFGDPAERRMESIGADIRGGYCSVERTRCAYPQAAGISEAATQ
jgi:N-methylhydantoinase B